MPFIVPPEPLEIIEGRTSITRLRKSFDVGIHQNHATRPSPIDSSSTKAGQVRKADFHLPVGDQAKSKTWVSMEVVNEHPAKDCAHTVPQRRLQMPPNASRLKSPVWTKTEKELGPQSLVSSLRRSKKSQTVGVARPRSQAHEPSSEQDDRKDEVSPTASVRLTSPRVQFSELSSNDPMLPMPNSLDGTPNSPSTRQYHVGLKPHRKGKVSELKKAFERGILDFMRKRQPTESTDGGLDQHPLAQYVQPSRQPVAPVGTGSPEDGLSKGSLFCSPLPTSFRRESNATSLPLKDKISIFEGLVKPTSSPSALSASQQNSNIKNTTGAPFLTDNKVLGNEAEQPRALRPSKLRGTSAKRSFHNYTNKGQRASDEASRVGSHIVNNSSMQLRSEQ